MNPVRKAIHFAMESTGLDRRIDAHAINARRERRHARQFPILSAIEGNAWIGQVISAGQPAAIGKIGDRECCALAAHLGLRQFYKYTWAAPTYGEADLYQQAGVFPPRTDIYRQFCDRFLERLGQFDGCAVWHNPGESRILAAYAPRVCRMDLGSLDPYFFTRPWSGRLSGKRVLVVHPFAASIRAQFDRRLELWPTMPEVLPPFELEVVRAPYGFSRTDFPDWLAMLAWLERQVEEAYRRKPFDVALIGCGAAGVPLAGFVKSLGAIGIHTGGPTQLLFGIRGGRWDKRPEFQSFFNDAWVRPRPDETPQEAKRVDHGGYW